MSENMKYCRFCGKQIQSDAVFCKYCGQKLDAGQTITNIEQAVPTEPIHIDEQMVTPEEPIKNVEEAVVNTSSILDALHKQNNDSNPTEEVFDQQVSSDVTKHIEEQIKNEEVTSNVDQNCSTVTDPDNLTDNIQQDKLVHSVEPVEQTFGNINTDYVDTNKIIEETNKQVDSLETSDKNQQVSMPIKKNVPKKKKGGAGKVVIIILLIIIILIGGTLGGSYLFRDKLASSYPDGGFDLPFDYVLEIPWIQEAKDAQAYNANNSESIIGTPNDSPTTQPQTTAISNENDMVSAALKAKFGDNPSASDYATITSVSINGSDIRFNQADSNAVESKTGQINLESLSKCTNLQTILLNNVSSVSFPTSTMPSVTRLEINNCDLVDPSAAGITNFTNVSNLTIVKTNLSDLTSISHMGLVKTLKVDENAITSTDPIKANMTNLEYCSITKNTIWDYRGLANVASVDIWGKGSTDQNSIYTMDRDYNSRQIQVLVIDLRIRTAHNTNDVSNILEERAVKNAYYYILDEYWDGGEGITWYKIGNDMWIASKENTWTKLYE